LRLGLHQLTIWDGRVKRARGRADFLVLVLLPASFKKNKTICEGGERSNQHFSPFRYTYTIFLVARSCVLAGECGTYIGVDSQTKQVGRRHESYINFVATFFSPSSEGRRFRFGRRSACYPSPHSNQNRNLFPSLHVSLC
jgi:hypothetical protein